MFKYWALAITSSLHNFTGNLQKETSLSLNKLSSKQDMTIGKTESPNHNNIWMCAFYYKETKASNVSYRNEVTGTEVTCAMYIILVFLLAVWANIL